MIVFCTVREVCACVALPGVESGVACEFYRTAESRFWLLEVRSGIWAVSSFPLALLVRSDSSGSTIRLWG